jgi:1-acyl-sn-glycerol-3-phosphate acyltransferase
MRMHWVYYFGRVLIRVITYPFMFWKVKGKENLPPGAVIIVCNHLHISDPPYVAASIPKKAVFMAKEELWQNKWSRFWVENFGSFPVRRKTFNREPVRTAKDWLGKGISLIMFPEGSRSNNGGMNRAFTGAALIALHTGLPVVPVAITGSENVSRLTWSFLHHPTINVVIGKPLIPPPCGGIPTKKQRNQFSDDIMYKIAELLPPKYRGVYGKEKSDN